MEGKGGCCLKLDVQGQGDGRILDVDEQGDSGVKKRGQFSRSPYVYYPKIFQRITDKHNSSCDIIMLL